MIIPTGIATTITAAISGGSRGGKSGHAPPSKLAMEFGHPSGAETVMIELWIRVNLRILAPP